MTRDVWSLHPSEALKLKELFDLSYDELRERYNAYKAELDRSGLSSEDQFAHYIWELRNWREKMIAILRKLHVLLQDKYAKELGDVTPELKDIEKLLNQLEGKEPANEFKYWLEDLYARLSRVRL